MRGEAAVDLGLERPCLYDDGTQFVEGQPHPTMCPEAAEPLLPHCGGPCGACPYVRAQFVGVVVDEQACVGMSDERGYGLCAVATTNTCRRTRPGADYARAFQLVHDVELSCLVLLDEEEPDGLAPLGWWVPLDNCRDYVARFRDSYACVDTERQRVE